MPGGFDCYRSGVIQRGKELVLDVFALATGTGRRQSHIRPTVLAPVDPQRAAEIVHTTGMPSQVERQEKRRGILPDLRNAKRRHCPRERFMLLILVVQLTPCTHKLGDVTHRS